MLSQPPGECRPGLVAKVRLFRPLRGEHVACGQIAEHALNIQMLVNQFRVVLGERAPERFEERLQFAGQISLRVRLARARSASK